MAGGSNPKGFTSCLASLGSKCVWKDVWEVVNGAITFDILVLLSEVRNARLLISFCTTKFCSSLLKFCKQTQRTFGKIETFKKQNRFLVYAERTWDLHQRMKISDTILKSSVESESGFFSHLDLDHEKEDVMRMTAVVEISSVLMSICVFQNISNKHICAYYFKKSV